MAGSYADLIVHSYVTFSVYPTSVLGTGFRNMKVMMLMDEASARQFVDTRAMHAKVFSSLPAGTPTVPDDFTFVKLLNPANGAISYIALEWINEATIVVETTRIMRLTIENVSAEDRPRIIAALSSNGFTATELVEVG